MPWAEKIIREFKFLGAFKQCVKLDLMFKKHHSHYTKIRISRLFDFLFDFFTLISIGCYSSLM